MARTETPLPRTLSGAQLYDLIGHGRSKRAWTVWLWRARKRGTLRAVPLSSGSYAYREDDVRRLLEGDGAQAEGE